MAATMYCTGLKRAALRLKKAAGFGVNDPAIEGALGISWYTFYRWTTEEDPRRINKLVLERFREVYRETTGRAPHVRAFPSKHEATKQLELRRR